MPITTEILTRLSVDTSPGLSTAGTPNDSLGGYVSSTQLTQATLQNLFDDISGDENAAGDIEYRGFFFHNSHASLTLIAPRIWLSGPRFNVEADDDVATLITETGVTAHDFPSGAAVRVEAEKVGDSLPGGLSAGTTYFVRDVTGTTLKLAATLGGAAINITGDGRVAIRPFAGALEEIGLATQGVVPATQAGTRQMSRIADEGTAPSPGVTFLAPTTKAGGLAPGDIDAAEVIGVWIRRTAQNSGALNLDRVFVRIEGDSAE
jgi:hypothetical protein